MEVLSILLKGGLIAGICIIAIVIGRCYVAATIARNNNMSDEKAKYLTDMMSRDININFPNNNL